MYNINTHMQMKCTDMANTQLQDHTELLKLLDILETLIYVQSMHGSGIKAN